MCHEGVLLKCSQTGKKLKSKFEFLTSTDMTPLDITDLTKGVSVMVEIDGKPYPAEFVEYIGML